MQQNYQSLSRMSLRPNAKARMDSYFNKSLNELVIKRLFDGAPVTEDQLMELYLYNMNIRRDTPVHDISFEHFYNETNTFAKIIACNEYHRTDGVKPKMAIMFEPKTAECVNEVKEIADLFNCDWRVFTWLRNGWGYPSACISLENVPDEELTVVVDLIEDIAQGKRIRYLAVKASPLAWTD